MKPMMERRIRRSRSGRRRVRVVDIFLGGGLGFFFLGFWGGCWCCSLFVVGDRGAGGVAGSEVRWVGVSAF